MLTQKYLDKKRYPHSAVEPKIDLSKLHYDCSILQEISNEIQEIETLLKSISEAKKLEKSLKSILKTLKKAEADLLEVNKSSDNYPKPLQLSLPLDDHFPLDTLDNDFIENDDFVI